jgi:hypothetical protein
MSSVQPLPSQELFMVAQSACTPRSAAVAFLLALAALSATFALAETASAAEAATCNTDNRGNVCEKITWCAGAEGSKHCESSYRWYPE